VRNGCPLNFSGNSLASSLLKGLVPFHKLVCEAEVWLDNHVQTSGPNETATRTINRSLLTGLDARLHLLCSWERKARRGHDFSNADCCRTRDANTTMHQGRRSLIFSFPCAFHVNRNHFSRGRETHLPMKSKHRSKSFVRQSTPLSWTRSMKR